MATRNGKGLPGADPETFIPERWGSVDMFAAPNAFQDAMREHDGKPPPPPDPQCGALTDGQDITAAFTELIREGKSCAYALLQRASQQAFPYKWTGQQWKNTWTSFVEERDGLLRAYMGDGGGSIYTATFNRALRAWVAVVPRLLTDEEARAHQLQWGEQPRKITDLLKYTWLSYQLRCKELGIEDPQGDGLRKYRAKNFAVPDMADAQLLQHYARQPLPRWYRNGVQWNEQPVDGPNVSGLPERTRIIPASAEVTTDECHRRWIEEFTAEVEVCIERFKDREELPHELRRLITEVKAFEVGQCEAKAFVEHLQSTAVGCDVLSKVADAKARLLQRLDELRTEYAPTETIAVSGQQLRWKGNTMELAEWIHILEEQNWIDGGRSRSKLAERIAAAFCGSDGEPLHLPTLKTYLGKKYTRTPREGVEFTATRNPEEM